MSEYKLKLYEDVKIKDITSGQLKGVKSKDGTEGGMKKCPLYFNNNKILYGKTAKTFMPFGLSFSDIFGEKYTMDISFGDDERRKTNPKAQKFYENIKNIEERVIDLGCQNRDTWFPGQFDEDEDEKTIKKILKKNFAGVIKVSKDKKTKKPDGKYPDRMKIKAPHYDNIKYFTQADIDSQNFNLDYGEYIQEITNERKTKGGVELIGVKIRKFNFELYDSEGELVDIESSVGTTKFGTAKFILRFSIWVMQNGTWGLSCDVIQAQLFIQKRTKGFAFGEDSDPDEEAVGETHTSPSAEDFITEKVKSTKIEDSEEDEEDEDEVGGDSDEESV